MLKKVLFLSFFVFGLLSFTGAQEGCRLRISLITCAPGAELYSTFGHTAVRVQDSATGGDVVYNYGTFSFDEDFYVKFIRGKLLYALSVEPFYDFIYQYREESRSVVEQELALTCAQKTALNIALQENALPGNRSYRYDFLFDNCTTRARDMVGTKSTGAVAFKNILPPNAVTFRNLIDVYLLRGQQHWSKLGIDLLLGAKMDRAVTNTEAMFLPDNLLKGFDSATIDGRKLVAQKRTMLQMPAVIANGFLLSPVFFFGLLAAVVLGLSLIKKGWAQKTLAVVDFLLFFILGAVGCLLLFMWFGTDHALCANNYNLLWAVPTNVAAAFYVHKQTRWKPGYFKTIFVVQVLLLVVWPFLPQQMNVGFLPLVLLTAVRSWQLSKQ